MLMVYDLLNLLLILEIYLYYLLTFSLFADLLINYRF